MLLGEPPRTQYDLNFSLFGIPIRVHPLFWLVTLMLGYRLRDAADVVTWIIAVFVSIMIHELGHALVMRLYGFRPWITLYGMGGLASYDQRAAYGSKGSGPLGQILTCLAGPVAGFLLAAVVVLGLIAAGYGVQIEPTHWSSVNFQFLGLTNYRLAAFLHFLLFTSLMWGVLNLLPIYPLDGGQIAREILLVMNLRDGIRQSLMLSVFAAGGLALIGLVQWQNYFVAMMFGFLAFESYTALAASSGRNPW